MTTFILESSVWGLGSYDKWLEGRITLAELVKYALEEGVNDPEYQEQKPLNNVIGITGDYIVTYDEIEDIVDVWSQLNE